MELKVTAERVRAAAARCKDAETVLKELFPDAFEKVFQRGDRIRLTGSGNGAAEYLYLGRGDAEREYYKKVVGMAIFDPCGHVVLVGSQVGWLSEESLKRCSKIP